MKAIIEATVDEKDKIIHIINWSELSRYITAGDRNCIRANKIPKKHLAALDRLFNYELPEWWKIQKSKMIIKN